MQLMDNSFSMVIQHWGTVVLSVGAILLTFCFTPAMGSSSLAKKDTAVFMALSSCSECAGNFSRTAGGLDFFTVPPYRHSEKTSAYIALHSLHL